MVTPPCMAPSCMSSLSSVVQPARRTVASNSRPNRKAATSYSGERLLGIGMARLDNGKQAKPVAGLLSGRIAPTADAPSA